MTELDGKIAVSTGMGRASTEVSVLASFLASERPTFITGAVIPIDEGSTCSLSS